jgi:aspartate kinase
MVTAKVRAERRMRPWVVMKFGGTSVGSADAMRAVARHVERETRRPLVVVSALGGVTDLLVTAGKAAREGRAVEEVLGRIVDRHRTTLDALGLDTGLLASLETGLARLLDSMATIRARSPRVSDMLLSHGERMSARVVAALLSERGLPARAFDSWELGLRTDGAHGRARPLPGAEVSIRAALAALAPGTIPVVTGYIGRTEADEATTLGRGGSDYTAAVFGAAACADEIQIWTDVPGILRADPRVVQCPDVVPAIRFEEAAELAFFGAKVLHPDTMEPARQAGVAVRVLGTFHIPPDATPQDVASAGTRIDDQAADEPVRAIALQQGVQSLTVRSLRMLEAHGFLARVFAVLARHRISVDVVATSEVSVSMTFDRAEGDLEAAVQEIADFADVERAPERSLLCLVGAGLRQDPSLVARVVGVLAAEGVPLHVISQGASRINLTLVTDPDAARRGAQALHAELFR